MGMVTAANFYLVVYQAPLFEEGVYTHDGANVTGKVPATSSHSKVLRGVQAVSVYHEVTVVLVDGWRLASVSVVEEFW